MDPVQVNPSAPNFNAWPQQNGVSAHQGRHPSSGLNSHGNEAQDCYHFEADPRFGHGSYPFSQCGLTDNYSLGYTTFATHFTQGSEIPRHYPVNNNERHASGDLHYGNRLERLPNVPQDAAVQEIWAHGDVRSNPPWSRPTSMGITHHVLMELDPVVADEQLVHGHPFSFRQGIAQLPPESATTRSVFPHHPSQDPDFLPQKTVTEDRHLLSYPWQDPVKPLHSEPMRRGSKVLPIHVRYGLHGGLETQPRRRNTWSRNIPGDYVSTSMGPNTGPRPEELLYNHWSRPASLINGDMPSARGPTRGTAETREVAVANTLGAHKSVETLSSNPPVASGEGTDPAMATRRHPRKNPPKPKSGAKVPSTLVGVQPRRPGSMEKDRRGSAGKHQVFDRRDMEEVLPARTRNLSPSGKEHAARVRAKGACRSCRMAKRKCRHVLDEDQPLPSENRQSTVVVPEDGSAVSTSPEVTVTRTLEAPWTPGSPLTPASEAG